jgi:hypothetical protein
MEATSMRPAAAPTARPRHAGGAALAVSALVFALVAYLGVEGGGFDPLLHDQVGLLACWLVLLGAGAGILPRRRLPPAAWSALGLFVAFAGWTALSLAWTESNASTWTDVGRVAGYLGIFTLALLGTAGRDLERVVTAVGAAIALVAGIALLSRLHPAWFPDADQTVLFIPDSRERLSFPIDYWNGLAGLIAIGLPLVLQAAAGARSSLARAAAAAALPALILTIFFTLSRGGIAAAVLAVGIYLAVAADRIPKLLSAAVAACGAAVVIVAASGWDALRHGLSNDLAHRQGTKMILLLLAVGAVAALAQLGLGRAMREGSRPRWTRFSRRQSMVWLAAALVALLVAGAVVDAPGRASQGWSEFKEGGGPGSGTQRLNSVAGQSRYELWQVALDQNAAKPLTGTGSGTFQLWWAKEGRTGESVRDTHSLYLQTLAELGVVGFLLLVAFLAVVFVFGGVAAVRAGPGERSWLAAAFAGCAAFCLTAAVDWMWQIPALAVSTLLLGSQLVSRNMSRGFSPGGIPGRLGLAAIALAAIVAIAIPLAGASLLRESESEARSGDLDGALERALSAQSVQPSSAAPRLQEALVLELRGQPAAAAAAARVARDLEPANWRNWLILARIDAERGDAAAAAGEYRRARALNPEATVFDR